MGGELRTAIPLLQGVTNVLGLERSEDGIVALGSDIQVVLDPWSRFEFALPRGEFYWFDVLFVAAAVGSRSIIQIHNDSLEHLVRIDPGSEFDCGAGATGAQFARTSTLATTDNGLIATPMDGRYPRPTVPAVRWRSQNNVALPAGFSNGLVWDVLFPAGTTYVLKWPVLLRPGGTFAVWPSVDNASMRANFTGSVRRIFSGRELTP